MAEKRTFDKKHPILDAMKQTVDDFYQHDDAEETRENLLKKEKHVQDALLKRGQTPSGEKE